MTKIIFRMDGKPNERLILRALCKDYKCKFKYDELSGFVTVDGIRAGEVRDLYDDIITVAYKGLAFAQAKNKFSSVPIRTLTSEYMAGFSAICCSLITGEPFTFQSLTEVHREGLKAAGEVRIKCIRIHYLSLFHM